MANGHLSLSDQWRLIKPVWRVCIAILVAQLIGMGVGLVMRPVGHVFLDLWYGGAYATPLGFVAGIAWQTASVAGSLAQNRLVILFLAVLCVLLPLFGYFTWDLWLLAVAR